MPAESDIVGAMNPDDAGRFYTRTLEEVFRQIGRDDLTRREHFSDSKDWNDELKKRSIG